MRKTKLITLLALACPALAMAADYDVVIDAANGGTQQQVQDALDAHPAGTTFLMRGAFVFSDRVHIEKSGTRIIGDLVDGNGDGKPGAGDSWNTMITGVTSQLGVSIAFELMPGDAVNSVGYDVSDVEISGIRFSEFNWPVLVHYLPTPDQAGCRSEPLPYQLDNLLLERNWIEGGGFFIYRGVTRATIDNNLFTAFEGNHMSAHAIEMRGVTAPECGMPFGLEVQGQDRLAITNNVFTDGKDISVGFQRDMEISGNVMTGAYPYPNGSYKLWISQASGAQISDNIFQGGPNDSGVLFWSRSNWSNVPDITSDAVDFTSNTFVDSGQGIYIQGGTDDTTINDNQFIRSGNYGPVGGIPIMIADVAQVGSNLIVQPSKNLSIKHNLITGASITGILLNGQTTGVSIKNNSFDNPYAAFGDVAMAEEDVLFGWGDALCPAEGNKVISDLPQTAVVVNGYSSRCEGSTPNTLLGDGIIDVTP